MRHFGFVAPFARFAAVAVAVGWLSACATMSCHENFISLHQNQVGQSADGPASFIQRYPQLVTGPKALANGNVEYEERGRGTCRSYYEVDSTSRKVLSWRFEGAEKDCEICP